MLTNDVARLQPLHHALELRPVLSVLSRCLLGDEAALSCSTWAS
jgi:hypothetical protein